MNQTAIDNFKLQGRTPHEVLFNEQGDVSNLCQFDWYQWVYYRDNNKPFPHNKEILGKVLGHSRGEGNEMHEHVLQYDTEVIPRQTVRPLTVAERNSPDATRAMNRFLERVEAKIGTSTNPLPTQTNATAKPNPFAPYEDDFESPRSLDEIEEDTVKDSSNQVN